MTEARHDRGLPKFSFAFQPIVDARNGTSYAFEALIRGRQGEPALIVLENVSKELRHRFDGQARLRCDAARRETWLGGNA